MESQSRRGRGRGRGDHEMMLPLSRREPMAGSGGAGLNPLMAVAGGVGGLLAAHYADHMYRMGMDRSEVPTPSIEGAMTAPLDHQMVMAIGAVTGYWMWGALA